MFERYTEKARRTIFFARYEASQFGSPYIEAEHLLLGLLREDKSLANRFLRSPAESIREQIERHTAPGEKVPTSVDLPLSHECKRVLAYGAEEAERLKHKHIGTEHMLLGLLREEKCFAARLLHEQGLTIDSVREQLQQSAPPLAQGSAFFARLDQWLAEREARGGIWDRQARARREQNNPLRHLRRRSTGRKRKGPGYGSRRKARADSEADRFHRREHGARHRQS